MMVRTILALTLALGASAAFAQPAAPAPADRAITAIAGNL